MTSLELESNFSVWRRTARVEAENTDTSESSREGESNVSETGAGSTSVTESNELVSREDRNESLTIEGGESPTSSTSDPLRSAPAAPPTASVKESGGGVSSQLSHLVVIVERRLALKTA